MIDLVVEAEARWSALPTERSDATARNNGEDDVLVTSACVCQNKKVGEHHDAKAKLKQETGWHEELRSGLATVGWSSAAMASRRSENCRRERLQLSGMA